jgi:hypothetical protein
MRKHFRLFVSLAIISIGACRELSAGAPDARALVGGNADRPTADAVPTGGQAHVIDLALAAFQRHTRLRGAVALMDGKIVASSHDGWWKTVLKSGQTVVFTAAGEDGDITEIEISFRLSDGVRLRNLVSSLGPYTKVFESKTAGVRFDQPVASGLVAFADLFSSKILPDSEVVRISIRRQDETDKGHKK